MIDWDDVGLAGIISSDFGLLAAVVVMVVFSYFACENEKTCAAMACPTGKAAELLKGQCLCVEPAK